MLVQLYLQIDAYTLSNLVFPSVFVILPMFRDTVLNNYTINQTEVRTLPSKGSKEIFHFIYCQMIRGVFILTENLSFFEPPPAGYQSWSRHQESGSTFSSSLLATHSGVGSTFQVSGWNSKLLVYLEVRDRIVD